MPSILSGLFMRGAADGLAEGVVNSVVKTLQGAWINGGQEAFQKVMKEDVPNLFGIGYKEEAEFNNALNRLSLEDRKRITRVRLLLSGAQRKRWEMIVATIVVEGLKHDPHGPVILPHRKTTGHGTTGSSWGRKPAAHHGAVDAKNTASDPRIIYLQNIADMVSEPGKDFSGKDIVADSDEAVILAAEYLRATALDDKPFFDWLSKLITQTPQFLRKQGVQGLLMVTSFFVDPSALRDILNRRVTEMTKVRLIEELLDRTLEMRNEHIAHKVATSKSYAFWIPLTLILSFLALLGYNTFG